MPENGHKLYPSASLTHPAIDAVLSFDPLDPSTVDTIEIRLTPFAADVTALREPETGAQDKFSTAHCVAVALLRRSARPAEFSDAVVADPAITLPRGKVRVRRSDHRPPRDEPTRQVVLDAGRADRRRIPDGLPVPGSPG